MIYSVRHLPRVINIGVQTETGVEGIGFDVRPWLEQYGYLEFGVWPTRPGETTAYPAADVKMVDGILYWRPNGTDTAIPGSGKVELIGITKDKRKLSGACETAIRGTSLPTDPELPDINRPWVDEVIEAANRAHSSANAAAESADRAAVSEANAESYKDIAVQSADAAQISEANAYASAESAALSAQEAAATLESAESAIDAAEMDAINAVKAQEAESLANVAESSEAAANSANAAATARREAQTAAAAAKSDAMMSSNAATAAQRYEAFAKSYANSAAGSAAEATEQAGAAQNAADQAQASQDAAAASASTASTARREAQQAAAEAKSNAMMSSNAATAAQMYDASAKTHANAASASAEEAAEQVEAAQNAAEQAQAAQAAAAGSAEAAQVSAEEAKEALADTAQSIDTLFDDIDELDEALIIFEDVFSNVDISDTLTFSPGRVNPNSGDIGGLETYQHTNPINVSSGDTITTTKVYNRVAAYSNGIIVPDAGVSESNMTYTVPDGIDAIVLSIANSVMDSIEIAHGKKARVRVFKYLTKLDSTAEKTNGNAEWIAKAEKGVVVKAENRTAVLGDNIADTVDKWHVLDGATISDGIAMLTAGQKIRIPLTVDTVAEQYYYINLDVTSAANSVDAVNNTATITLGGDEITIFSANDGNYKVVLTPIVAADYVEITGAGTAFALSISGATVKQVVAFPDAVATYNNIPNRSQGDNMGYGFGHKLLVDGDNNTAFGVRAQEYLTTGIWNTAVGTGTQRRIKNGIGNTAVGQQAQANLTTGAYNVAVGTSAQAYLTTGCWNVSLGNETGRCLTTGCNNVAIGRRAFDAITIGNGNIAVGAQAGFHPVPTVEDSNQILIGIKACKKNREKTDDNAIAIGAYAQSGENGIAIGANVSADDKQIAIGSAVHDSVIIAGKRINFNSDGTVTWETI